MKTNNFFILGISCGYHDSAAALIKNGEVVDRNVGAAPKAQLADKLNAIM
jgi:predicted NodU family carbamoyl transferase